MSLALALSAVGGAYAEGLRQTIRFPKGESSATLRGNLARGNPDGYTLAAREGQTMAVEVSATEDDAAVTI